MQQALERLAEAFDGTLAVAVRDEVTGETLELNADREMPTVSTIKLAVLAAVFEQVPRPFDRGQLREEPGSEGRIRVACKTGMIDGVRAVWSRLHTAAAPDGAE